MTRYYIWCKFPLALARWRRSDAIEINQDGYDDINLAHLDMARAQATHPTNEYTVSEDSSKS